jgi:hypothetical protein
MLVLISRNIFIFLIVLTFPASLSAQGMNGPGIPVSGYIIY